MKFFFFFVVSRLALLCYAIQDTAPEDRNANDGKTKVRNRKRDVDAQMGRGGQVKYITIFRTTVCFWT